MEANLNAVEIRIMGSLMEKALSTPDYYPLSLSALLSACNQKSSRDPVVAYDAPSVQAALEDLEAKGLVDCSRLGRVPKFAELFGRRHDLMPPELAALAVLLLRGPQTAGEIRSRTARMHRFAGLEEVLETLARLTEWGLCHRLARLPGHKEDRYEQTKSIHQQRRECHLRLSRVRGLADREFGPPPHTFTSCPGAGQVPLRAPVSREPRTPPVFPQGG